jgi:RNA polymerase sigma-70 factor, ECF subfamily
MGDRASNGPQGGPYGRCEGTRRTARRGSKVMIDQEKDTPDRDQRNAEFVRLLKQHDRRVAAYIFSLVPHWNDAEDLLQNTCVRLWEQFDDYRAGEDFGAWACTIARYEVMTYRKRTGRERLHFSSEVVDALAAQVAAEQTIAESRLRALADCTRRLADSARRLLDLCYVQRVKVKDAAAQLGRSVNATYLMLSRARRELHDCVEATLKTEEKK